MQTQEIGELLKQVGDIIIEISLEAETQKNPQMGGGDRRIDIVTSDGLEKKTDEPADKLEAKPKKKKYHKKKKNKKSKKADIRPDTGDDDPRWKDEPEEKKEKPKKQKVDRGAAMREAWKRRRARAGQTETTGEDVGDKLKNQLMKCNACDEEFIYSGYLLDAVCRACQSSAVVVS